jgi:hypothetical protein
MLPSRASNNNETGTRREQEPIHSSQHIERFGNRHVRVGSAPATSISIQCHVIYNGIIHNRIFLISQSWRDLRIIILVALNMYSRFLLLGAATESFIHPIKRRLSCLVHEIFCRSPVQPRYVARLEFLSSNFIR